MTETETLQEIALAILRLERMTVEERAAWAHTRDVAPVDAEDAVENEAANLWAEAEKVAGRSLDWADIDRFAGVVS